MKDKLLMILFILVLGGILSSSLVLVDNFTSPLIKKNESVRLKSSILQALSVDFTVDLIDQTFADNIVEESEGERTYYISSRGDYALPFSGSGLWGPITGILAMKPNLTEVTGITIMHQEETPGLGSRIADQPYLSQFIQKEFSPQLRMVGPGKSRNTDEIDSISGATMSSKAFIDILNGEQSVYKNLLKGSN